MFESIKQKHNNKRKKKGKPKDFPSHPIFIFPSLPSWPFLQIKHFLYYEFLNICHRVLHLLEPEEACLTENACG